MCPSLCQVPSLGAALRHGASDTAEPTDRRAHHEPTDATLLARETTGHTGAHAHGLVHAVVDTVADTVADTVVHDVDPVAGCATCRRLRREHPEAFAAPDAYTPAWYQRVMGCSPRAFRDAHACITVLDPPLAPGESIDGLLCGTCLERRKPVHDLRCAACQREHDAVHGPTARAAARARAQRPKPRDTSPAAEARRARARQTAQRRPERRKAEEKAQRRAARQAQRDAARRQRATERRAARERATGQLALLPE